MKKLIIALSMMLCCVMLTQAQNSENKKETQEERERRYNEEGNPFKKYGYKPRIITLSKGKYKEFFTDSVVQIGSFTYNRVTKEIVGVIIEEEKRFESDLRPDLVSRWMSPDPLSDEFPDWSPYNFVENSPIRYVDPTGLAPEDVIIKGDLANLAFEQLQASTSLTLTRDDKTGKVTASGEATSEADQVLLNATTDNDITVNINATSQNVMEDGTIIIGGNFGGNRKKKGKVTAEQTVNPNQMQIIDDLTERGEGVGTLHEVLEAFIGAKDSPNAKQAINGKKNKAYRNAHSKAKNIDPRHIEIDGVSPNQRPYVLPNGDGTFQVEKYIRYSNKTRLLFKEKKLKN